MRRAAAPAQDARAAIAGIGTLAAKIDGLADAVGALSSSLDAVRAQVRFIRGAFLVIGGLIVLGLPLLGLLARP